MTTTDSGHQVSRRCFSYPVGRTRSGGRSRPSGVLTQVPSRTTQRHRSGWQSDSMQPSLRAGMFLSPRPGCIPGRVSAHSPGKRQGLREQEERQSPSRPRLRSPSRRPLSPRHSYRSASGTPTASFAHAGIAQRHRGEGPTRAEDSEAEVSSGRASVPGGGHARAATEIGRHRVAPSTEPAHGPEITRSHIARSPIAQPSHRCREAPIPAQDRQLQHRCDRTAPAPTW